MVCALGRQNFSFIAKNLNFESWNFAMKNVVGLKIISIIIGINYCYCKMLPEFSVEKFLEVFSNAMIGGSPIRRNTKIDLFLRRNSEILHIFWRISEIRIPSPTEIFYLDGYIPDILK